MTIAKQLKEKLKNENKELLELIESNNISDETLIKNAGPIMKYLNQSEDEDYKMKLHIADGEISFDFFPNTLDAIQADRISSIKKNYLMHEFDDKYFLIDIQNDLIKDKNRLDFLKMIEGILKDFGTDKDTRGYFLWGDYGIGKTWITIGLLNKFAERGYKVAQISWTELFRKFKNMMADKESFEELMDRIAEADVLFIDDLSGEKLSDWSREEIMFPILNQRLGSGKLTLFTSNLPLAKYANTLFLQRNNENEKHKVGRIIERIKGLADEIHLAGPNLRITNK